MRFGTKCAATEDLLPLYADGELAERQRDRVARHLDNCPRCAAALSRYVEISARVGAALRAHPETPSTLEARVMETIRKEAPRPAARRPAALRFAVALGVCAIFALGFGAGAGFVAARGPAASVHVPVVSLAALERVHRLAESGGLPLNATATTPDAIDRALRPAVLFPVEAVELPAEGLRLDGAGHTVVEGVPVAVVRYSFGGRSITLLEMDAARLAPDALAHAGERRDTYVAGKRPAGAYVLWRQGGRNCVMLTSAVPMHDLFRLACHACEKQESL